MWTNIQKLSKWLLLIALIGIIIGSISAFFLEALDFVTSQRDGQMYWVYALPLGGLIIGYSYFYLDKGIKGGNNHLIKEMVLPKKRIHWKMTPLVLFGTLATHLFGGSAGREGTAVQMGGATADQFSGIINNDQKTRKTIIRMGVAAGFASVFGTPLAGILFTFELARDKKVDFKSVIPIVLVSYIADYTCTFWGVGHTTYEISQLPEHTLSNFLWVVLAALLFGLSALFFNYLKKGFIALFDYSVKFAPLKPFIGGVVILIAVLVIDSTKFLGLGIPTIEAAFHTQETIYTALIKIVFTAFTLGAGFKGGEATPLFFIGATLGSALILFIPLPISFLAGLGFIAVFAGSTNTPLACIAMGVELFGIAALPYYIIVCIIAFLITGNTSVYSQQREYLKKISLLQQRIKKPKE